MILQVLFIRDQFPLINAKIFYYSKTIKILVKNKKKAHLIKYKRKKSNKTMKMQ